LVHDRQVLLRPPQITSSLDPQAITGSDVADTAVFSLIEADACDLVGANAKSVLFDKATLNKVQLMAAQLLELKLADVRLTKCDLSNAALLQGSWRRVEAIECRMTGVQLGETTLADVCFERCKLNLANFRYAQLATVRFIDCDLRGSDFLGARLKDVAFEGCDLADASFHQANLEEVDLRTSAVAAIKDADGLRGGVIDSVQLIELAPLLAATLGIRVLDGVEQ
jgi:uncharacterized protein YjbI with pentapeptide repeats